MSSLFLCTLALSSLGSSFAEPHTSSEQGTQIKNLKAYKLTKRIQDEQAANDLKALDMADEVVTDILPAKPVAKPKPVPKVQAAPKTHFMVHKQVASEKSEPLPEASSKASVLWSHEDELRFSDDAEKVLDKGDAAAHIAVEERKAEHEAHVASAHVVKVSEEEAEVAQSGLSHDDALEGSESIVQDLKDLKAKETDDDQARKEEEDEAERIREKNEVEEKAKVGATGPRLVAQLHTKPKKTDLDKLMKLSAKMMDDANVQKHGSQKETPIAEVHHETGPP